MFVLLVRFSLTVSTSTPSVASPLQSSSTITFHQFILKTDFLQMKRRWVYYLGEIKDLQSATIMWGFLKLDAPSTNAVLEVSSWSLPIPPWGESLPPRSESRPPRTPRVPRRPPSGAGQPGRWPGLEVLLVKDCVGVWRIFNDCVGSCRTVKDCVGTWRIA